LGILYFCIDSSGERWGNPAFISLKLVKSEAEVEKFFGCRPFGFLRQLLYHSVRILLSSPSGNLRRDEEIHLHGVFLWPASIRQNQVYPQMGLRGSVVEFQVIGE
jgi:hypothetical protein